MLVAQREGPRTSASGAAQEARLAIEETSDALARIEAARGGGIRFIQLQFTDILGVVKAVTIPVHRLEDSVRHGTWFDGSSIEGFTRIRSRTSTWRPTWRRSTRSRGSRVRARAAPRG